jgi:hypothetical protein
MHEPTDEQRKVVKTMSAYGVPIFDIAKVVEISPTTLQKHYQRELDMGQIEANAKIGETLFKQAVDGNIAAAIFWAKVRMGWRETMQLANADGSNLNFNIALIPAPKRDDE